MRFSVEKVFSNFHYINSSKERKDIFLYNAWNGHYHPWLKVQTQRYSMIYRNRGTGRHLNKLEVLLWHLQRELFSQLLFFLFDLLSSTSICFSDCRAHLCPCPEVVNQLYVVSWPSLPTDLFNHLSQSLMMINDRIVVIAQWHHGMADDHHIDRKCYCWMKWNKRNPRVQWEQKPRHLRRIRWPQKNHLLRQFSNTNTRKYDAIIHNS